MTEHVRTLKEVEDVVANNDVVVVKVGATWCLPCQKVQPLYEAEAKSSSWKALVYDISKTTKRDQDPIMTALGVAKIPYFAVFKVRCCLFLLFNFFAF
jgi:thioredoxin 1